MSNSEKELITSDGQKRSLNIFCIPHVKRKRLILIIILSLVAVSTLVVMFGIYAAFKVANGRPLLASIVPVEGDAYTYEAAKILRNKRAINEILKISDDFDGDKNLIKRDTDYENIENFLDAKYHEINKNDASEEMSIEDEAFIQKRSNELKNSIRKLEDVVELNEYLLNTLVRMIDDSGETANFISKNIDEVEYEIKGLDEDIVDILESSQTVSNSIHKRIRHKRDTDFSSPGIDPVAIKLFTPLLEEKKREKRQAQLELAEVRDEFIRCRKSATEEEDSKCDAIYIKVMDRFREITKKFREIEEIVEEMEKFHPSKSADSEEQKKNIVKMEKKNKKSSEESKESSEERKKRKSTTEASNVPFTIIFTTESVVDESTDVPIPDITTEETTTVFDSTDPNPREQTSETVALKSELIVQPENFMENESSTISSKMLSAATHALDTTTQTCPASAFNNEVRAIPKFHEDIDEKHSNQKFLPDNHHSIDDLIARKFERSQANPFSELLEGAKMLIKGAEDLFPNALLSNNAEPLDLGKSQNSQSSVKGSEVIGASGPFIALCDQLSKQQKQSQQTQQFEQPNNFMPVPVPLSNFANAGIHFPTGETMKATSKVFMNPNYNMMQYPMCFVNYPQYRMQQQQFYYPGLTPITMPGGYFIPSANAANLRPIQMPLGNQGSYRNADEAQQPTYCTFLASEGTNFPAHYIETTEQPSTQKYAVVSDGKIEESSEQPEKSGSEGNRESSFNVPSQFDIIYATYPNQIFAMNHSMFHHCDEGKLPCFGSHQCISKSKWCDSKVDCLDASDETACSCKARLPDSRICDGFVDCPMGSDEMGCFGCDRFQYSCYNSRKEFLVNGGSSSLMCYSSTDKCDGFRNCLNGKDELECSMIVKHLGGMLSYAVSYSVGILHHNFKGRWYPVCKNPLNWASHACEMENGKTNVDPSISIKSFQIPGPFIQPNIDQRDVIIDSDPIFTDTCQLAKFSQDENQMIFVECPPPACGVSKKIEIMVNPGMREKGNTSNIDVDPEARIVGGDDAKPMEYPFIVAIYKDGNFHCGGSIYNENWIITAAHCARDFENHFYEVRAGILRRSSYSPSAQITKVSHVIRHEAYDMTTMKNDIALMKLKHQFLFNRWVRPICLPSKGRTSSGDDWKFGPAPGTLCSAIGWGAIREKGPDPDDLKVVDVPIIAKCKHSYDESSKNICAGETFGTRDACQGDSGGPFVCKSIDNPSELYLAGIVSHGEGCARANEPGVYTRVALYLDWIRGNANERQPLPLNVPDQQCPGHACVWGGSKCISDAERCDGFVDCLGGEDEIECTINWLDLLLASPNKANHTDKSSSIDPVTHSEDKTETGEKTVIKKDIHMDSFRCSKIPQVVHIDQRCDKIFDCEDGSDEENCTCRDRLKPPFAKLICDGHVDCEDSSDEEGCLTCNDTEFACLHSKVCIEKSLHCNGAVDCQFREDELECLALTDGTSVTLDINGKPFLHSKGIVAQNIGSTWKILCDDNGDFHSNGLTIANDICNVIGFKSAKSAKVVEIVSSNLTDPSNLNIDIRIKSSRSSSIINKEKCGALEIECILFQSNSFAVHPIQHEKIKKNSTVTHSKVRPHDGQEIIFIFVPVNTTDQTHVVVEPVNKTHQTKHLQDYEWPWNVEIFVNGDLSANGVLLDKSWVLVEKNLMGSNVEPLHDNHVVALLGNTKSQLSLQSPHEQLVKIDCSQPVNDSNVMLLHLENPVEFNRYVFPSFLPLYNETEPDSTCLAIALDSHFMTKSLGLKIVKNCSDDAKIICYQQVANVSQPLKCDGETSHRTATIVCKSKTSGWYPKAFQPLKNGFCDFQTPISVFELQKHSFPLIQEIIDHPCQICQHHAVPIKCSTHRCLLGKCVQRHQLCDGVNDCHDGSDETQEVCRNIPDRDKLCKPSDFYCRNGRCVDKSKFCDHVNDCGDKSDEPSECTCFSYLRATDPKKVCDGIRHCWDRTDEDPTYCGTNCSVKTSFKCGSSPYCVPLEMVCDTRADCPNGADEQFCDGIYQYESNHGYGEIMERSFGIWHTKCFPKSSPPTQEELELLCKRLGFKDTAIAVGRIMTSEQQMKTNDSQAHVPSSGSPLEDIPVEFKTLNATKVIPYSKFSAVKINDGFTVHLRPSKPLAKLVSWDVSDHLNCHRMELQCLEEKK